MNKKGYELTRIWVVYLILFFIVVISFLNLYSKVKQDNLFDQKYLAIDSAFLLNAISISPYDVNTKVTYEIPNFILDFKKPCLVETYKKSEIKYTRVSSSYRCLLKENFNENQVETPFLKIQKQNNQIIIQ